MSSNNLSTKDCQSSPVQQRADDSVLYEVMTVEASLVAFVSLLSNCKDILTMHEQSLVRIVDTLEICFRNMKNKYQPSFRNHFRFRTFHCILLECFTLLPAGVYPNTSQQIYIEALRVFRDSISLGYECSCGLFNGQSLVSPAGALEALPALGAGRVPNEKMVVYILDSHVNVLQKKESEAFLAIFGKDVELLTYFTEDTSLHFLLHTHTKTNGDASHSSDSSRRNYNQCKTSSSVMDTRLFDMSIVLLALTFAHQSSEYQDKAITLFAQASSQLLSANLNTVSGASGGAAGKPPMGKTSSLSLFNSSSVAEEERRKKDKKQYGLHKNIVTVLYVIMFYFPKHSGSYYHEEYAWRQKCIDYLFEVLGQSSSPIVQTRAAQTLAMFATKWTNSQIVASISQKILTIILSTYAHTKKNAVHNAASSDCYIGYIIALGHLYTATSEHTCQSLITTTLIDCIRKMDNYTITFQTAVLASLCVIMQHVIGNISTGAVGDVDMLPSVVQILQVTLSNVHTQSDMEYGVYLQHSISLTSRCIVLSLLYQQQHIQDTLKFERDGWELFRHIHTLITLYYGNKDGDGDGDGSGMYGVLIDELCKGMVMVARCDGKHTALGKVVEWFVMLTKHHTSLSLVAIHALTSTLHSYITRFEFGKGDGDIDAMVQDMVQTILDHHGEYILLSLLEYTISKSIGSVLGHHTNNIGMEISLDHTRITNTITITTTIIHTIYTTLTNLANLDIHIHTHTHTHTPGHPHHNTHTRLVYWLCMCMCMCMELGQKASNSLEAAAVYGNGDGMGSGMGNGNVMSPGTDDTIIDREGDGDGNEGGDGNSSVSASSSDGTIHSTYMSLSKCTYTVDSHHHMVILYKDLVTKLTSTTSTTWRVGLKYQLMVMVHTLITTHSTCMMGVYAPSSPLPDSVSHTREHAHQYIHHHNHQVSVHMFLYDAPMSPVLILGELISLTCNMISYTLHERYVVSLQDISLATLDRLIQFYKDLKDPDSPEKDAKLLSLYISQIFAAIRTCLSISHHPSITYHTIHTLLTCYTHTISRDYTSLKRIFKPILTYWQQQSDGYGDGQGDGVCMVNTQTIRCHEDIALQEALVYIHTLAQCYLIMHNPSLSPYTIHNPSLEQGLVQVMVQVVGTHTPWGYGAWRLVCEDALRVVCGGLGHGDGDGNGDDVLGMDMVRGGAFFTPANLSMLSDGDGDGRYGVLYMVLPTILLAMTQYIHHTSKTPPPTPLPDSLLQSILYIVLYKLQAVYDDSDSNDDGCAQYIHILEYISSQTTYTIPYTHWHTIISLHIHNHHMHKLLGVLSNLYTNPTYTTHIQYVEHLQFLVLVGYDMVYGTHDVYGDGDEDGDGDGVMHHDLHNIPGVVTAIHKCTYTPHHIHQYIHLLTTALTKCSSQDIHTHHHLAITCAYLVYVLSITYIHTCTPDTYTSIHTLMCSGVCDGVWKRLGDDVGDGFYGTHTQDIQSYVHYMFALAVSVMDEGGDRVEGGVRVKVRV
ncbi:hypothetical protein EON63_07005 [archaeon]|nr:MAG: hypothetical protein EON63_07005 [archaeon]